ncbi:MAG TPA: nucleosidase [Nocardioidaceae bacterium]|nr:nucleosidase [Nocardioidaceae bacterium]
MSYLVPVSYLVVCATHAEAAYVPKRFPVVLTGLGKTAAAVATAAALAGTDRAGLTVINVGTAGALRPGLHGLFLPSTVLNHDIDAEAIRGLGYDPQERLDIGDGDGSVLASGDLFVTDPAVRDRLAQDAHLVDMEGYAVAYACRRFEVPLRLVKHVSDHADETALDWPAQVDASARALGEWLEEHLE